MGTLGTVQLFVLLVVGHKRVRHEEMKLSLGKNGVVGREIE